MDPIFQEESARLSWTKEQYLQAAEDERLMLSALPRLYPNDPNLLNELQIVCTLLTDKFHFSAASLIVINSIFSYLNKVIKCDILS